MANNLDTFITDVLGLPSRNQFAELLDVSRQAVNNWTNGDREIPYHIAKRFGVNYAWLAGDESEPWSERVHTLRREMRRYLADKVSHVSPSQRFRLVVSWLTEQAPDLVTDEFLAMILRLQIDTYRLYTTADASVGQDAIERLAAWVNVPSAWFSDGDARHFVDYNSVAERAKALGVTPVSMMALLDGYEVSDFSGI